MPDEIPSTPATNAVKALARFLHEPPNENEAREQIQAELKRAGIDSTIVFRTVREKIEQAKARQQLAAARAKREAWLARIAEIRRAASSGATRLREQVKELLESQLGGTPQAAVLFRKFEEASDEDLQSLLDDLTLLDQIGEEDDTPET